MYSLKKKIVSILFLFYVGSIFSHAQIPFDNILLDKCLFAYTQTYKYIKNHKAFAYARVAVGEEDYCAWSQAVHNQESARATALKACKEANIDAKCKIVDVNNAWLVGEGDFSIIIPADQTALLPAKVTALVSEANTLVLGECITLFKKHLHDKGHKVFAYTIDEDGYYSCATSKEHQTLRKAALVALKRCEDTRISFPTKMSKNPCLSFSDGKKILVGVKEYNLTLDKKPNTFVSQEVYKKYVKKAKQELHGACLTQFKYYLKNKDHKAFYIAKDTQDKLVCGLSFDSFTIASAKKQALEKCESAVKRKKIDAKCKLFGLNLNIH
jgi:hypothetical protein